MPTSNVSSVTVPANSAIVVAPADNQRTYLRISNSSLADLCVSVSQAAAQAQKGIRNTGGQADFELSDEVVGQLVAAEFWCFNKSTVAANVAVIQGYRV